MKRKIIILSIALAIVNFLFPSCRMGLGDQRDRNLELVMMAYLDSVPEFEYIGMSDTYDLDGDRFQAVSYTASLTPLADVPNAMLASPPITTARKS